MVWDEDLQMVILHGEPAHTADIEYYKWWLKSTANGREYRRKIVKGRYAKHAGLPALGMRAANC